MYSGSNLNSSGRQLFVLTRITACYKNRTAIFALQLIEAELQCFQSIVTSVTDWRLKKNRPKFGGTELVQLRNVKCQFNNPF